MTDHAALTQEEQEFAAEHCGLIDLHLKVNGLDPDKWWDVLVFGYLTAVRCWFRVPQVRRWAFPTIAKVKMRGAMCNQLQYENRAMRRGQAASLDADLDGLEAVTLYDLVNHRLNTGKPTIINTNLGLQEIERTYSSRVYSRLAGMYAVVQFKGRDIRLQKKKEGYR